MRALSRVGVLGLVLISPVQAQLNIPSPSPMPPSFAGGTPSVTVQPAAAQPSVRELLSLVPIVSTQNRYLRTFAFDVLHTTGREEGMRTRGWYTGPGQLSLMVIDERDGTPLLYLQGGKGVVFDAAGARCLTFSYGSCGYHFGRQGDKSLIMGLNMHPDQHGDHVNIDLRSPFSEYASAAPLKRGAYWLSARGETSKVSIRLSPGEPQPWGQFLLVDTTKTPHAPMVGIEIIDVNRPISTSRLAFPSLSSFASELNLQAFPTDDDELNRCWQVYRDGFKRKAPAEIQSRFKQFDTPRMKESQLALMLLFRSHFIRYGLRNPEMRSALSEMKGDLPIVPAGKKIDWDSLAGRDRIVSASLRSVFAQQMPLHEPPSPAAVEALKLFKAVAQKLASARGYKVDYEGKVITSMSMGNIQGTLLQAPGNRLRCSFTMSDVTSLPQAQPALPVERVTLVSDGKNVACHNGYKVTDTEVANDKLDENLPGWLIRTGVFFGALCHVRQGGDNDYRTLEMSDLKVFGKEMVNGRLAKVISYTLTKGEGGGTQHRLWIDADTGLPVKQTMETRDHFGFTETYRNWRLAPVPSAEAFALPK